MHISLKIKKVGSRAGLCASVLNLLPYLCMFPTAYYITLHANLKKFETWSLI